jgi:glycine hydroxymethyltransferase
LASLIAQALRAEQPQRLAEEVREWRGAFNRVHFVRS